MSELENYFLECGDVHSKEANARRFEEFNQGKRAAEDWHRYVGQLVEDPLGKKVILRNYNSETGCVTDEREWGPDNTQYFNVIVTKDQDQLELIP